MSVISVNGLFKSYGSVKALSNVSFDVPEGSIFGFLGPNGAGKSTTIGILMQFLRQDSGSVKIFGMDVRRKNNLIGIKERVGFIPDADLPKMQAYKLLRHTGKYFGLEGERLRTKIIEIVRLLNMKSFINQNTRNMSRGQKSRVKIANALLNDPDLIIADEPTSGLDPVSRSQFLELITKLTKEFKKTVFLSSHVIGEIEKVSSDLLILSQGKVVSKGTFYEITKNLPVSNRFIIAGDGITEKELQNLPDVVEVQNTSLGRFTISTKGHEESTPQFLKSLAQNPKITISFFSRDNVTLESIFFDVVRSEES